MRFRRARNRYKMLKSPVCPLCFGGSAPIRDYWHQRRRRNPAPIGTITLRLLRAQQGRCPICRGLPLHAEHEPLNPVFHLTTSAVLLVAGAAIGGLGFAQQIAVRRAERKQAEQIRRDAATAERERLARSIHDGVLQVLTLVQRHGLEIGGQGTQLATPAAEQEVALRTLLTGTATPPSRW
ncbi:hypothetical protein [Micromonospora sp. NPDC048830]|uniref:hypothetical protein n=1 Tax=Micromonospora sp. NPDC048830 TaxID=3364257 RepID=UPI003712DE2D